MSLRDTLNEIVNNPVTVNDNEFDKKVSEVSDQVQQLYNKANNKLGLLMNFFFLIIILFAVFFLYFNI